MELTRTDAVFSRIILVASFCAELKSHVKSQKNHKRSFWSKRATEPQGDPEGGHQERGPPPGAAGGGPHRQPVQAPRASSPDALWYLRPSGPKSYDPRRIFPETLPSSAAIRNRSLGVRSSYYGTLPGRGLRGDRRHHHHQHLSINHPWLLHPCVSNSLL